jgi:predicted enzyme related to lactoylglutathione lyase
MAIAKKKKKTAVVAVSKPAPKSKKSVPKARSSKPASPPTAASELKKVAFTLFPVEDAARARRFYERVLGLKRGLASPDGVWTEYDLPGGGCLALFLHPDPSQRKPGGGGGIAFEVSDLDALNRRLKKASVTYHGDVVRGPHCRMSNISDSEGNPIILHQLDH